MKLNNWLILLTLWGPAALCSNEPVVARVNGEEIPAFRLERYFAEYLEDQGRAVASIRNPKAYKQLRQTALQTLIDKELLWQESQKRGVQIDPHRVLQQVEQTRSAIGGTDKFLRRLQDAGFDEASFTEYTRRELAAQQLPVDAARIGIFGHSMGGHGALTMALKRPDVFRSVSAFAPIAAPSQCPWGVKAFSGYLGEDRAAWAQYDASLLMAQLKTPFPAGILIDQGPGDVRGPTTLQ